MVEDPYNWIESKFPRLRASRAYELASPCDEDYNCIAFAAGDTGRWWWPDPPFHVGSYWPSTAPSELTVEAFVQAFESLGYQPCADGSSEEGLEKVALYVKDGLPTHAARQDVGTSMWLSKLGGAYDIRHRHVEDVSGKYYGQVACFLSRPANGAET